MGLFNRKNRPPCASDEALAAVAAADEDFDTAEIIIEKTNLITNQLKNHLERNHFAERIEKAFSPVPRKKEIK